ncbi:hypothetical protein NHX12_002019 [Muraenolepis orangiensis]|uniref:Disintegrin domain-containing protein n=1 Tax=Muraenolepis orangiensis TaxID=630683 RepID=A0A9Q0E212_9TELE|nr:hypothetical protein NHX12_002019 [Muraenolepis orangiensis]
MTERRCQCQNEPRLGGCIMEPSTGFMPGQQFSSCSAKDLSLSLVHGGGMCLFNVPQPERLLGGARCGNLYVEKGEQCDCGLLEECDDPCCNASTCRLQPGAQCSAHGTCCEDCKLRSAGWACREPLGECDLPEFCTGTSAHCPANVFLQNGEPCEDSASYCFGGTCTSLNSQCQMLWGANASHAPALCFSSVNKQGNKYGNWPDVLWPLSYIPCRSSDVLCGKLQCQGGSERPVLSTGAEILITKVQFNHSDLVCRGTYLDLGDDVSDPATVAQGTACGPHKACLDQRCQDVSMFRVEECRGSTVSTPGTEAAWTVAPPKLLEARTRLLCHGEGSPFHKSRQHNRTPVTERVDECNGEQVRPLRYQWNRHGDIPLSPPSDKVHDRPAPPTKPLPPDPELKKLQSRTPTNWASRRAPESGRRKKLSPNPSTPVWTSLRRDDS